MQIERQSSIRSAPSRDLDAYSIYTPPAFGGKCFVCDQPAKAIFYGIAEVEEFSLVKYRNSLMQQAADRIRTQFDTNFEVPVCFMHTFGMLHHTP